MPSPYDNAEQSRKIATGALVAAEKLIDAQGPEYGRLIELATAWARVYAADVEFTKKYT